MAALPDGRLASGGDRDGTIKLWPKDGLGEPVTLKHSGGVSALAALPDGRFANSGGVSALAVLPDGRLASSGGDDGTIKLWPKDEQGRARHP